MLNPKVTQYQSSINGTGLKATSDIKEGDVVWKLDEDEERLTLEQLQKLPPDRQKLAYQQGDYFIIVTDGSEYMNHSCDPNTWWDGDETLVACRDIKAGEEVTYDYATAEIDEGFRSKWECRCGAEDCRKVITGSDCLDLKFQEKYRGHLPSWVVNFIEKSYFANE